MHIRQLTETDAEIFRAFRLSSLREAPHAFTNSYEEYSQQTIEATSRRFREHAESQVDFMLGAFENGQLIGSVGFHRETALKLRHKGYLISMYVIPEYRSRGTGRALLVEAISRARRLPGLKQLLLGVVVTQITARRLYESLGFVEYGREPDAVKIGDDYYDEVFMLLKL